VTDLIEITVPDGRTLVPADSAGTTWRYELPENLGEVVVGGGDIAPVSTAFSADTMSVSMPLTPGARQIVLRYVLDSLALELPLPGETGELEVLVREPAPELEVSGLVGVEPVELEPGVFYRRYAAAELRDSVVTFRAAERTGGPSVPVEVLMVLLALGMVFVGVWAVRRGPAAATSDAAAFMTAEAPGNAEAAPSGALDPPARQRLLLEIARLDEKIEAAADRAEIEDLRAEREALLAQLGAR